MTRLRKNPPPGKKEAPRQSCELEEPAAKEFSRPSLLGGETARLPEVPRRIPAGARRVEELPGTSRSRLPGQRERFRLQRAVIPNQETEEAGAQPGANTRAQITGQRKNRSGAGDRRDET